MLKYLNNAFLLIFTALTLSACDGSSTTQDISSSQLNDKKIIIYTNADAEAQAIMNEVLQREGFGGKYLIQTFGTAELGGRLLAEGTNIEADVVTMSAFFLDSAQDRNNMFMPLSFEFKTLVETPNFYAPITSQEGTIIINTKEFIDRGLPYPTSLEDLGNPVYRNLISITDPASSSTGWLLTQAIVSEKGFGDDGKNIMNRIIENAGAHVENSGSAPLKNLRAGEVAVGFGLRHQAIADKLRGLPIDFIDPKEGNFSLLEAIAIIDKGDKTNPLAMQIAEVIVREGRPLLQAYYPNAIYEGESTDSLQRSAYPRSYATPLTVEELERHIAFFHNKY